MKITKIEAQKNRSDRSNIYINEEFFAGICNNVLIEFGLFEGMNISFIDKRNIVERDEYFKAFTKSLGYLSRRIHSEQELRKKTLELFPKKDY